MSSFSRVLLEEGVEMEIPASLSDALGLLDEVVPTFTCQHYGYQVGSVNRAKLGSSWGLWVKLVDRQTNEVFQEPVGCVELEKIDDNKVNFRVPARAEQDFPGMSKFDGEGHLYGSFIYQMLNLLHERKLIQLPGVLPTF
ncbi:MAG: hypothetical protein O2909_00475 [Chloroflexi bacterium]|nr:hypothetical protein [Chloroflexota bacterium]MDA1217903.1 hypothetical protein [Chloroflexota bacterium]PKB56957.1 MAG: hypothetical protein BZY73_05500 [SAR202 cluster bacterium Casp-Chloro-G3]